MKQFYNNLKLRTKILLGFCAVVLVMLFMIVYTLIGLGGVIGSHENLASGHFLRRDTRYDYRHAFEAMQRHTYAMIMYASIGEVYNVELAAERTYSALQEALASLDNYNYLVLQDYDIPQDEKDLRFETSARVADILLDYYINIIRPVYYSVSEGDLLSGVQAIRDGYEIADYLAEVNDFLNSISDAWIAGIEEGNYYREVLTYTIIAIGVISIVLVSVIISLLTANSISKPVKQLSNYAFLISQGDLESIDVLLTNNGKDEISTLLNSFAATIDTIKSLISDLNNLSREFTVEGDIDYRIDANKYRNSFKGLVEGVNNIVTSQANDILPVIDILKNIVDGNFDESVQDLPGKKMILSDSVRTILKELDDFYQAISSLAEKAAKGNLEDRIDQSIFKGKWALMAENLNHLLVAVYEPISTITASLVEMQNGNFESALIDSEYKGNFETVKVALNETAETTLEYIDEIADILTNVSDGDLSVLIHRDYVGSYSPIKAALESILDSLNITMAEIQGATHHVLSGADQITQSSTMLALGVTKQNKSIIDLSASISTINQKAKNASESVTTINGSMLLSKKQAEKGSEAVKSMEYRMNMIKGASEGISDTIDIITSIAFQTNLLALNASVEAARAGEHGRGFSVVADEVRALAGRCQQAASRTNELVSEDTVAVDAGLKATEGVISSFTTIAGNISEMSVVISEILDLYNEQLESISGINESVAQISDVVSNATISSLESASAAEELNSQARLLNQKVKFFKLRSREAANDEVEL